MGYHTEGIPNERCERKRGIRIERPRGRLTDRILRPIQKIEIPFLVKFIGNNQPKAIKSAK